MIELVFLGTGAAVPTESRGLPSIVLRYFGELLMFDCGEGTQRQFVKAKLGLNKPTKIFITHMHGDHVFGLPGLLHTMDLFGRERKLEIYGPPALAKFLKAVMEACGLASDYEVEVYSIVGEGTILETERYSVKALKVPHTDNSYAFAFVEKERPGKFDVEKAMKLGLKPGPLYKKLQMGESVKLPDGTVIRPEDVLGPPRPGLKVVYSGDTPYYERMVDFSRGADVLIHDSSFLERDREKALESGHSTVLDAVKVAREARVKLLVLTHISARYAEDEEALLEEAKKHFENVVLAKDLMRLKLRG